MKLTLVTIISLLTLTSAETCHSLYKGQTCTPDCAIFECEATPKEGAVCSAGSYLVKRKVKCGRIGGCHVDRSNEDTDQYQCVYDFDCVSISLFYFYFVGVLMRKANLCSVRNRGFCWVLQGGRGDLMDCWGFASRLQVRR